MNVPRRQLSLSALTLAALVTARALAAERAAAPAPTAAPATTEPAAATNPPATNEKSAPAAARPGDKKAAPKMNTPPPVSPRFKQVRERISALLGDREGPAVTYDPRYNPFRLPGAAVPVATTTPTTGTTPVDTAPPPPASDAALLRLAAAQLKVTGFAERDGRTFRYINQSLYKQGDVVKVTLQGQVILLRITKLTRTSLTLKLNDVEQTLNF